MKSSKSIVKKKVRMVREYSKYNGSWRIVSMKTNPPSLWPSKFSSREKAELLYADYQANKH